MSLIIGIIEYGIAGNTYSIQKALEAIHADFIIIRNAEDLNRADRYVLPGVGSFPDAMLELETRYGIENIKSAFEKKLVLGICLGMQILSKLGYEFGKTNGLSLINAEVKEIECSGKVPHMGFNTIDIITENSLFKGIKESDVFYFMHSFEVVSYTEMIALTTYENHQFVSAVNKENFYGVQFHPEKSRDAGLQVFKNFIEL